MNFRLINCFKSKIRSNTTENSMTIAGKKHSTNKPDLILFSVKKRDKLRKIISNLQLNHSKILNISKDSGMS